MWTLYVTKIPLSILFCYLCDVFVLTLFHMGGMLILTIEGGEQMTQGERVKEVRKFKDMTMEKFGDQLGVTRTAISNIEKGYRGLTEQMLRAICREFNVNEEWLRTGEGEMSLKLSEDEEIADLVSDVLEDGKSNPFYGIILEIVRTYNELSPASQEVIKDFSKKLVENIKKED